MSRKQLTWVGMLVALGLATCVEVNAQLLLPDAAEGPKTFAQVGARDRFRRVLEELERSIAPQLVGVERWRTLLEKHRPAIEATSSHKDFTREVSAFLDEMGVSHLSYIPDHDWRFGLLGGLTNSDIAKEPVAHIGIVPQEIDGHWFVRGILEGSPASFTRMRVGDRVVSVDGIAFDPVMSFRGKAGQPAQMVFHSKPGVAYTVAVVPVLESLYQAWIDATVESVRTMDHAEFKMAYLHAWCMFGSVEYDRLHALKSGVDGLLLDFRDGYGGYDSPAHLFLEGLAGMTPAWQKSVVILTSSDGTRSAKEIVAARSRALHHATLVGTPSAGAVLGSSTRVIGGDAILVVPVQWNPQENRPIRPDVHVGRDIRYCGGGDPQLDKAKDVLAELIRTRPPPRVRATPDVSSRSATINHLPGDRGPGQLEEISSQALNFNTGRMRQYDVDGDGNNELLLPSWRDGIHIVHTDGSAVERVRFESEGNDVYISSIEPVRIGGRLHWFVSSSAGAADGASRTMRVALYAREGERVWFYELDIARTPNSRIAIAVGDLDGDGTIEFVIGVGSYRMEPSGAGSFKLHDIKP